MIRRSDDVYLRECKKVFTISQTVADRLKQFNGLKGDGVLYPPLPRDAAFHPGPFGDYIFYPSRVTPLKRQALAVEAMKYTRPDVRLVLGGTFDADAGPAFYDGLRQKVLDEGLGDRIEFTGWLTEERKVELMAGCCAVLFPACLEDYGYVTLEALHSGKPVVTLTDSGAILELVEDGVNGLVAEPEPRCWPRPWTDCGRIARWLGEWGSRPGDAAPPSDRLGPRDREPDLMKIAIVNAQAPFVRGGAEYLADSLATRLTGRGHKVAHRPHSVQVVSSRGGRRTRPGLPPDAR